jgi:hypothetical protein
MRLDGVDLLDPAAIAPPPDGLTVQDLNQAIRTVAAQVAFTTPAHPDRPHGWHITWGDPDKGLDTRPVSVSGHGEVTDSMVAAYMAKYATKATEVTGHTSARLTEATIGRYADAGGGHAQRLVAACWRLGRPITGELHQPLADCLRTILRTLRMYAHNPYAAAHPAAQQLRALVSVQLADLRTQAPQPLGKRPQHRPARPGRCARGRARTAAPPARPCNAMSAKPRDTNGPTSSSSCCSCSLSRKPSSHPTRTPTRTRACAGGAHMLGFGGHFLTKTRRYSIAFRILREARIVYRRTEPVRPQAAESDADRDGEQTTLLINSLALAGVGWHTSADAMLAQTTSALAREHQLVKPALTLNEKGAVTPWTGPPRHVRCFTVPQMWHACWTAPSGGSKNKHATAAFPTASLEGAIASPTTTSLKS